jgi:hypothetical protein
MGVLFFFDEGVPANIKENNNTKCQIEVADNHGVPELRVGPEGAAYNGTIATFNDWIQFERFVTAINDLKNRLAPEK